MLKALWTDEAGAILCIELILVGTVLGIGLITGLTALRDATVSQMAEVTAAACLDQSYTLRGQVSHSAATADSVFANDQVDSPLAGAASCLIVDFGAGGETGHEKPAT